MNINKMFYPSEIQIVSLLGNAGSRPAFETCGTVFRLPLLRQRPDNTKWYDSGSL